MQAPILYNLLDQNLWLSAERSIFWEEQKTLVVADLHFGKTGHFRKSGVAVPQSVYKEDLQRLLSLLQYFQPSSLIVVGDFFHSHTNTELQWFQKWRSDFPELKIRLVKGNHDILRNKWYADAAIEIIPEVLSLAPFFFRHEHCTDNANGYTFCGHIHPGVIIHGLGKQSLRFPCFYFGKDHAVLPAFSKFTGTAPVELKKEDNVFAIVEDTLVKIR